MMHDRIADEGDLEDLARPMPASLATLTARMFSDSRTAFVISASPPGFIIT
jgi:hypothetical protein